MRTHRDYKKALPSALTFGNLISGFLAITSTAAGEYSSAGLFIIAAALFDVFDGMVARLTKTSSNFGIQIDSLSDLVSFGVAPAFLLFSMQFKGAESWAVVPALLYLIGGGFRLARFNAELKSFAKEEFNGCPIPLAALTVVSYTLFILDSGLKSHMVPKEYTTLLLIVLAFLMVSRVKYASFPALTITSIKENYIFFGLLAVGSIVTILTNGVASFYLLTLFLGFGVIKYIAVKIYPFKLKR